MSLSSIDLLRAPRVHMAVPAYRELLHAIGHRPPETGGILLGPLEQDNVITHFHFDSGGACSEATYSPDHLHLQQMLRDEWAPRGRDCKGFVHSHPGSYEHLSPGDLDYIRRLLVRNEDMSVFVAPIVLPLEFRMNVFVVFRSDPTSAQLAELHLF